MRLSVSRCALAVTALLIVACDTDDVTGIPAICGVTNPVRRITLTPAVDTIFARDPVRSSDSLQLTATAFNRNDEPRSDIEFQFESSDTTVVVVNELGVVQAVGPGTAVVTAAACGERATASVTVIVLSRALLALDLGADFGCGTFPLGRGYCWGLGDVGQLGSPADSTCFGDGPAADGALPCTLLPKRVELSAEITQMSAGDGLACVVTASGGAYCWGLNDFGQLGNGGVGGSGTPVSVYGGFVFGSITAGGHHACALSGTRAYCWGQDALGQLGDAGRINSTTPIPVVNGQSAVPISFSQLSAGYNHTCGVALGGAAFCWGDSRQGQVGNGVSNASFDQPMLVAGGLAFSAITAGDSSHTCALTSDGQAFCWGDNTHGQLGNGSNVGSAVPVAVTGGLSFTAISAGRDFTCARTGAGEVWCWGLNNYAQLGNGPFSGQGGAPSNVPVRVVSTPVIEDPSLPPSGELSFTALSAGRRHVCAIATDGNAYCWGSNVYGALGNELQAAVRGVPVRMGTPR